MVTGSAGTGLGMYLARVWDVRGLVPISSPITHLPLRIRILRLLT